MGRAEVDRATGIERVGDGNGPGYHPMPNGWNGDWRRVPGPSRQWNGGWFRAVGGRMVLLVGGRAVRGRGCPRTGSGVPAAGPLIILSQIGEVRLGAGVIRSQPVLSPSGSGFAPPNEISYRAVKLLKVPAAFGRLYLRCCAGFPQMGQKSLNLSPQHSASRHHHTISRTWAAAGAPSVIGGLHNRVSSERSLAILTSGRNLREESSRGVRRVHSLWDCSE